MLFMSTPPRPPLHSKQTPLPLLLQRGEKIPIQNPDGESSRKEGFSRCHVSPLHGSVRRNLECGVYVCADGRWRPASPRTLNARWWLLGSGTWGQSRPGAREVFELPQPTSRAPQRRGGTPSPSDLEMRASVRFASAHVCQRRSREAAWPPGRLAARRGVQVRRTEDRPTAGPAQRHRGQREPDVRRAPTSLVPDSYEADGSVLGHPPCPPPPLALPSFEMKEFGGSGCATAPPLPSRPRNPGPSDGDLEGACLGSQEE